MDIYLIINIYMMLKAWYGWGLWGHPGWPLFLGICFLTLNLGMSLNEPHFPRRKNKNNAHLNEVIHTRDDDTTLNRVSFKKKIYLLYYLLHIIQSAAQMGKLLYWEMNQGQSSSRSSQDTWLPPLFLPLSCMAMLFISKYPELTY